MSPAMIVDVHAHLMPDWLLSFARQNRLGGSFENRFVGLPDGMDLAGRFTLMDDAEVARQVLSPACALYSEDRALAIEAARRVNDHYAAAARAHPDRLSMWVSLPLPHVRDALDELRRGLDDLSGAGVVLGCFCLGESIASEPFEPIYAELDRRAAVVFLHPCQNGIHSRHINDWGLTVCAGASLEDSVAALHLISRRIPARYPNIRFIVPHFGGILPMLLDRLDGQMGREGLPEPPSVTARRFFYDTVGWGSRAALIAAVEAFGADHLVTGSDFPVLLRHETYRTTFDHIRRGGLPQGMAERILGNAAKLLAV